LKFENNLNFNPTLKDNFLLTVNTSKHMGHCSKTSLEMYSLKTILIQAIKNTKTFNDREHQV